METLTDQADRLSRKRARVFPVLAILLIVQQASFMATATGLPLRAVDMIKVSAWAVLVLVLLAGLMTGGNWLRSRELRALIDDEVTRAHRASALATGFVVAILTGVVCYVVAIYEATDARMAIHIIVTAALAAALLRFAALERRALRDG